MWLLLQRFCVLPGSFARGVTVLQVWQRGQGWEGTHLGFRPLLSPFSARKAFRSTLHGVGLSSALQEAFRPIKSLMIISQLLVWWQASCVPPHTASKSPGTRQNSSPCSPPYHTLSKGTAPGSRGDEFPIEPRILPMSKRFVQPGPVGKPSCWLCDRWKVLHGTLDAHKRGERM